MSKCFRLLIGSENALHGHRRNEPNVSQEASTLPAGRVPGTNVGHNHSRQTPLWVFQVLNFWLRADSPLDLTKQQHAWREPANSTCLKYVLHLNELRSISPIISNRQLGERTVVICKVVKLCDVLFSAQSPLQKDIDQIAKKRTQCPICDSLFELVV